MIILSHWVKCTFLCWNIERYAQIAVRVFILQLPLLQQTKWKCLWMLVNEQKIGSSNSKYKTTAFIDIFSLSFWMSQNAFHKKGCDHCVSMISFCAIPFSDYVVAGSRIWRLFLCVYMRATLQYIQPILLIFKSLFARCLCVYRFDWPLDSHFIWIAV